MRTGGIAQALDGVLQRRLLCVLRACDVGHHDRAADLDDAGHLSQHPPRIFEMVEGQACHNRKELSEKGRSAAEPSLRVTLRRPAFAHRSRAFASICGVRSSATTSRAVAASSAVTIPGPAGDVENQAFGVGADGVDQPLRLLAVRSCRGSCETRRLPGKFPLRALQMIHALAQCSSSSRPKPAHLVADAVGAQRVPVGRRVDGDHGLAEPQLGGRRQAHHRRLVPTCTMASTSSPSRRRIASRHSAVVTSAMPVQDVHCSAMSRTTVKPTLAEVAHDLGVHDGPVGRQHRDALDAARAPRWPPRLRGCRW